MVVHEAVGVDRDLIAVLIFEEEVIVELLGPVGFEEPVLVMALPGDMEGRIVFEDKGAGERRHTGDKQATIVPGIKARFLCLRD